MTGFEILIISLKGDHIRKAFQKDQMTELGLSAIFMDAVTPADLPKDLLDKMSSAWARPLRTTEVALTHSHLQAWKKSIEMDKPVLILEDDAVLCSSVPGILRKLSSRSDLEFVQLETFNVPKLVGKTSEDLGVGVYQIRRLYRDRGGAAAYFIWPKAARKLIASVKKAYPPADAAIDLSPGIIRHQIMPAGAIQAMNISKGSAGFERVKCIAPSSVSVESKPPYKSKSQWLKNKSYRVVISLAIFKKRLSALSSGEYREAQFFIE